jgi:hypothetical protein
MTNVLSQLRTSVMPQVFAALGNSGVVETMSVSRTAQTSDGAGGFTAGSVSTPYTSIPVDVKLDTKGNRVDAQGKPVALQTYILTFPVTKTDGSLITIDLATDRLVTDAVSPYPAKTYRIISPADDAGVVNAFVCVRED